MLHLGRAVLLGSWAILAGAGAVPAQEVRALKLVDAPTAEVMERGSYDLNVLLYPDGGVLLGSHVGLMRRFTLGFTFGGLHVVGRGEPDWNPRVEFNARYQLLAETYSLPGLALGFDSQGFGYYDRELERYQVKSKGFFLVASRNYAFFGRGALHGGLNLSLEGRDGPRRHNPDAFLGIEKSLGRDVTLVGEYDAALNEGGQWNAGGRLNLALVWSFEQRLRMQLDARNLLRAEEGRMLGGGQSQVMDDWSRGIQISYREKF